MDALRPLAFANASFDLINTRNNSSFVPTQDWPRLLAECKRVLRPGGIARITEGEGVFTNKPAMDRLNELFNIAKKLAGFSFSGTGRYQGNIVMLGPLLRNAGFRYIQHKASTIDFSHGSKAHENMEQIISDVEPFLLAYEVITPEALTRLREEVHAELQMEDFRSLWYVVTAWGEAPDV
jgi:SAM-dependent methyltransferase